MTAATPASTYIDFPILMLQLLFASVCAKPGHDRVVYRETLKACAFRKVEESHV